MENSKGLSGAGVFRKRRGQRQRQATEGFTNPAVELELCRVSNGCLHGAWAGEGHNVLFSQKDDSGGSKGSAKLKVGALVRRPLQGSKLEIVRA